MRLGVIPRGSFGGVERSGKCDAVQTTHSLPWKFRAGLGLVHDAQQAAGIGHLRINNVSKRFHRTDELLDPIAITAMLVHEYYFGDVINDEWALGP